MSNLLDRVSQNSIQQTAFTFVALFLFVSCAIGQVDVDPEGPNSAESDSSDPVLCSSVDNLPPGLSLIGRGAVRPDLGSEIKVHAGQSLYVKLKNTDVFGTQVDLKISQGDSHTPPNQGCIVRTAIPTQTQTIYRYQVFGETPAKWLASTNIINVDTGAVKVDVYGKVYTQLSGVWQLQFRLEHNSQRPNDPPRDWIRFNSRITHRNFQVRGTLNGPNVRGNFSCSYQGRICKEGRMRLSWDSHDWQVFSFDLNGDEMSGVGKAEITFSGGHVHKYSFRMRKLGAAQGQELGAESIEDATSLLETPQATGPTKTGYIAGRDFLRTVQYVDIEGLAIVEGDIVIGTVDEVEEQTDRITEALENGLDVFGVGIDRRGARWPNASIFYCVQPGLPNKADVEAAMAHWESETPIRFFTDVRLCNSPMRGPIPLHMLRVVAADGICAAHVGAIRAPKYNYVYLDPACGYGTIVHELGHTVGLWHEQSREDRNQHVRVVFDNISDGESHNFTQHISDGIDLGSYDYDSIMHYGAYYFSKNGLRTIETIPPGIPIGQRARLNDGDIAAVRAMYAAAADEADP